MFDAKKLLDQIVGAGGARTTVAGQAGFGGLAGQMLDLARQQMGGSGLPAASRPGSGVPATTSPQRGGQSGDFLAQAKDLIGNNQMAAGAVLGSLGTMIFTGKKPKGLVGDAVKLGGLALIGGLAYKAYQNYQAGRQPEVAAQQPVSIPAPAGSAFDAEQAADVRAMTFIRAMIAAASADGAIDAQERTRIVAGIEQAGLDHEAAEWLEHEMANPASIDTLAKSAQDEETASQIYMAARIAIDPDHPAEKRFLAGLAGMLGLEPALVAHINATARQAVANA